MPCRRGGPQRQGSGPRCDRHTGPPEHKNQQHSQDPITMLWSQPQGKAAEPEKSFAEPEALTRPEPGQRQCH